MSANTQPGGAPESEASAPGASADSRHGTEEAAFHSNLFWQAPPPEYDLDALLRGVASHITGASASTRPPPATQPAAQETREEPGAGAAAAEASTAASADATAAAEARAKAAKDAEEPQAGQETAGAGADNASAFDARHPSKLTKAELSSNFESVLGLKRPMVTKATRKILEKKYLRVRRARARARARVPVCVCVCVRVRARSVRGCTRVRVCGVRVCAARRPQLRAWRCGGEATASAAADGRRTRARTRAPAHPRRC